MAAKNRGRPRHVPTPASRKKVEKLAGDGVPHESIAILVGLSDDKTLRKHYRHELDLGIAKAHAKVGGKAFRVAMSGSEKMIIWITKTQMGWKENRSLEISSPEGKPLGIEFSAEPELLGAYVARMERIAAERRANTGPHQGMAENRRRPEGPEGNQDPSEG